MSKETKTLIQVTEKTKTRLDKLGMKGDTYNDIIEKLLGTLNSNRT